MEGKRSAMIYGVLLNENILSLNATQSRMKSREVVSVKSNGITGYWISFFRDRYNFSLG